MQRDMKVGMALGMALVGIVAALFFRRGPEPNQSRPKALESAAELDAQIAEKPKGPYIHGLEEFADAAPGASGQRARRAAQPTRKDPVDPPGFLVDDDDAPLFAQQNPLDADSEKPPSAYRRGAPLAEDPVPEHNRIWRPSEPEAPSNRKAARDTRVESKPAARTHTIKPGDTLSSLAARYLGSSARYQEIFEANRKLLKSPNELPEGLVIVIPEAHRAVTPSPETQRRREPDRSPEAPATSSASGLAEVDAFDSGSPTLPSRRAGKLRFEPVRRSGFSAGRVRGAGEAPSERARSQPAGVDLEVEEDDAAATP